MTIETGRNIPLNGSVKNALDQYFRNLEGQEPNNLYQLLLEEVEKPLLERVLDHTSGNQTRTATILGISRGTLRKKLKQYHLE